MRKGLEEMSNAGSKASLPSANGTAAQKAGGGGGGGGGGGVMDTHMREVKKVEDNRRMREAFGLGDDYAAGDAFDEGAQERKKEARKK